jgi:hypothetical protein
LYAAKTTFSEANGGRIVTKHDETDDIKMLGTAIALLVGQRDAQFRREKPLTWFQFKNWLVDDRPVRNSFSDSGMAYCARAIRSKASQWYKADGAETPGKLLSRAATEFEELIDVAFPRPKGIHSLINVYWIGTMSNAEVGKRKTDIERINRLTTWRLRLRESDREPSVNQGVQLSALADGDVRVGTLKSLRAKHATREAFWFVADQFWPELLNMTILKNNSDEITDADRLKRYFGQIRGVIELLNSSLADALARYWSDVESAPPVSYGAIPQKYLDADELMRLPRRPAEETAKGNPRRYER